MRLAKHLVIGLVALLALSGVLGQDAFARRHKDRAPKSPKYHYKADKNAYLFGGQYKKPKKQHPPRGSHHDKKTGTTVYGK